MEIHPSQIREIINEDRKEKLISVHSVTKSLKKMELKLHKYANKWLLSDSKENKGLLDELFRDYGLIEAGLNENGG